MKAIKNKQKRKTEDEATRCNHDGGEESEVREGRSDTSGEGLRKGVREEGRMGGAGLLRVPNISLRCSRVQSRVIHAPRKFACCWLLPA